MSHLGRLQSAVLVAAMTAAAGPVLAGGSNYTVTPGSREVAGKISEWPVPTPRFARDPAVALDGNIYIAVMRGNRIARFDPRSASFHEWDLPRGAAPHGLVTDERGTIWYTGNGNATLGELDPRTGSVQEHKVAGGGGPHTIIFDGKDSLWFTDQSANLVVRYDRAGKRMSVFKSRGNPYGLALDRGGNLWFCQLTGDRVGRIDARTGTVSEVFMGAGSAPRRIAAAPDGSLWAVLHGNGKLAKIEPEARRIAAEYAMPAGENGNPYAITVAGDGKVWANEIRTDTVALFDPKTEKFRVFQLPSKDVGIRKMVVDGQGRLWYMGSHNGRLGVIE
jgi:virginiamycin B lyase